MLLNDYTIDKSPAKTHSKEYIKYFIMKHFFTPGLFIVLLVSLYSCQSGNNNEKRLQLRLDSVESKLAATYKPGLGEFMSSVQTHHAKLWLSGEAKNWELADFEIKEIKEIMDDITQYCTDRPEVKSLPMINIPIDSIGKAIGDKNEAAFKSNFILLTQTCNNCHQLVHFSFNRVKIPDHSSFSNQDFTLHDVK